MYLITPPSLLLILWNWLKEPEGQVSSQEECLDICRDVILLLTSAPLQQNMDAGRPVMLMVPPMSPFVIMFHMFYVVTSDIDNCVQILSVRSSCVDGLVLFAVFSRWWYWVLGGLTASLMSCNIACLHCRLQSNSHTSHTSCRGSNTNSLSTTYRNILTTSTQP